MTSEYLMDRELYLMYIKLYRQAKKSCEKVNIDSTGLDKSYEEVVTIYKEGLKNEHEELRETSEKIQQEAIDYLGTPLV